MKGTVEMMEYMFLTLFSIIMIIAIVIFLSWWQVSQLGMEKTKSQNERALVFAKNMATTPFLAKEEGMLDDAKLTAFLQTGADGCLRLREIYGADGFIDVRALGGDEILCTADNYPDCNHWVLCKSGNRKYRAYAIPVNIYRNLGLVLTTGIIGKNQLGSLEAGVYYDS